MTIPRDKRARKKLLDANRGLLSEVARRCRVSDVSVWRVWHGREGSARILAALLEELGRRQGGDNGR